MTRSTLLASVVLAVAATVPGTVAVAPGPALPVGGRLPVR